MGQTIENRAVNAAKDALGSTNRFDVSPAGGDCVNVVSDLLVGPVVVNRMVRAGFTPTASRRNAVCFRYDASEPEPGVYR